MVVSPRVTLLVFFTLAKLAVTARAWSSLHSSFKAWVWLLLFVLCWDLCSLCSSEERTQPFPTRAVFTPNLCNTFCLQCEMLVSSHTHSGTKEMGSRLKAEEAKQGFREERKGLGEEKVQAQRQKAAPCHPLCCGASGSFPCGLLGGPCAQGAVQLLQSIHRPVNPAASSTASALGELTTAVHSAYRFLFWWLLSDDREAQGKEYFFNI